MAENENPTLNNVSRTELPPPVNNDGNHRQAGISNVNQDETSQDDYLLHMEDEVIRLRKIEQLYLEQQARSTQQRDIGYQFPSPQQNRLCSFKTFKACGPKEFEGGNDPMVTLNWLRDTERKFDVCQCEDELRVKYAVQLLKGQAMNCWDSATAQMTPEQRSRITWAEFHREICKQFCSEFDMIRLRQEFLDLEFSEKMTMDELINQFTYKLRFVQQWVPDERTRITHFVKTLPPQYRTSVRLARSLTEAFELARSVHGDNQAWEKLGKNKLVQQSKSGTAGNKSQNRRIEFSEGSVGSDPNPWCAACRSRHSGPCTPQTLRCIKCGAFGHGSRECTFPQSVCWNCKKEGHRAGQCPENVRQGLSAAGSSGSGSGSASSIGQKRKMAPPRAFQMTVGDQMTVGELLEVNNQD